MKKNVAFLIALLLILNMVVAGCGKKTDEKTDASNNAEVKTEEEKTESKDGENETPSEEETVSLVSEPGVFPIVNEPYELDILVKSNPMVEDFETNEFTKWYEEKTGVKINWHYAPSENASEKVNIVLASGDYPDIFMDVDILPEQQVLYGDQGVFVDLKPYIDEHAPNLKAEMANDPVIEKRIMDSEGRIYAFPTLNENYNAMYNVKLWMYKPWLDKFGLDVPQTTEEYYQALKTFVENDANGNGKKDEIGLTWSSQKWGSDMEGFFMNSFVPYTSVQYDWLGIRTYTDLEEGKVFSAFTDPNWKEGVKYLNKLYEEGLMDEEGFTQNPDQLKAKGVAEEVIVASAVGGWQGSFLDTKTERGLNEYVCVPPLEGPTGQRAAIYSPYSGIYNVSFVVTSACENPEVAVKWADGFYDPETTLFALYGKENEGWKWAEEGELGLDGNQAIFEVLDTGTDPQNSDWANRGPINKSSEFTFGEKAKENHVLPILVQEISEKYEPYKPADKYIAPPMISSKEEIEIQNEYHTDIMSKVQDTFTLGVLGSLDIEAEWEGFLEDLNALGLETYMSAFQSTLDRHQ